MKKTIIALSLLSLAACTKKTSTTTSTVTSLNTTEGQLVGTWYLSNIRFTTPIDTTWTGYDNSCYVEFDNGQFPGTGTVPANYKKAEQAFGAAPPPSFPSAALNYWYYDQTVSKLVIGVSQYNITTLSGSNLSIQATSGLVTYSFHK